MDTTTNFDCDCNPCTCTNCACDHPATGEEAGCACGVQCCQAGNERSGTGQ